MNAAALAGGQCIGHFKIGAIDCEHPQTPSAFYHANRFIMCVEKRCCLVNPFIEDKRIDFCPGLTEGTTGRRSRPGIKSMLTQKSFHSGLQTVVVLKEQ